jgi:hypothetical protein
VRAFDFAAAPDLDRAEVRAFDFAAAPDLERAEVPAFAFADPPELFAFAEVDLREEAELVFFEEADAAFFDEADVVFFADAEAVFLEDAEAVFLAPPEAAFFDEALALFFADAERAFLGPPFAELARALDRAEEVDDDARRVDPEASEPSVRAGPDVPSPLRALPSRLLERLTGRERGRLEKTSPLESSAIG